MDACEPAGYSQAGKSNRWQATRMYETCYAIVCTNPSEPDGYNWDPDQRILRCVAFSRLVLPTAIGFQYAARVKFDEVGKINTIVPSPGRTAGTVSSADSAQQRHWLTEEEWAKVSELLSRWPLSVARDLPRINRAIRYFEETAREFLLDDRYELLVRTAEVLWGRPFRKSRKSKQGRGARFKSGLTRLANELRIEVSDDHADRAWQHRSRVTHGIGLPRSGETRNPDVEAAEDASDMVEPYMKVEEVLRTTIRRAIEDDDFAARFKSETSLDGWLSTTE